MLISVRSSFRTDDGSMVEDKVYVALAGGTVQTYDVTGNVVATRKGLAKRPIEQLGYLRELSSLVVLSG